ncbi:hypothetical protein HAX54_015919, partial [Datura stramonium]|nr:hypothetical protein [Datura stramonium]
SGPKTKAVMMRGYDELFFQGMTHPVRFSKRGMQALQSNEGREAPAFQHEERRDARPLSCDALRSAPSMSGC